MKKIIRHLLCLLAFPLVLCGCNQEDDVIEIFDSGIWNVENFYSAVNWGTNGLDWGKPEFVQKEDLETIRQISIVFKKDGTFVGELSNKGGSYSGKWEADSEDRTFSIIGKVQAPGNITGKNKEFIQRLQAAKFYRGDSRNVLRLAPESKNNCIQFTHLR